MRIVRSMMRSVLRAGRDRRGIAMTEFALSLPFLVLLYVGGFQICDAVSAYRKVTRTARTIADLTSQYTSVKEQDVTNILNASQQVMAPYSSSNATMTVTQVRIPTDLNPVVDWSRGKNTSGLAKNASFNLPLAIRQPDTYLIIAQIRYTYTPLFGSKYLGSMPLTETIIMSPRASASVTLQP